MSRSLGAIFLALLMMTGCALSFSLRSTCQEKVALILNSTCSPEKKNKLAYAAVASCSSEAPEATRWFNQLTTLNQPLQCEEIPKIEFELSWNMATTPELVKTKKTEKQSSQGSGKKGCLTGEIVRDVLGKVQRKAKDCYEKALPLYPTLSGKITTYFEIDREGAVTLAGIKETTMYHRGVEDCLLSFINKLQFPKCLEGPAAVTYPWIFKSYASGTR